MQETDNAIKIAESLKKYLPENKIKSIPKRIVNTQNPDKDYTQSKHTRFSDAMISSKLELPISHRHGLLGKLANFVLKKLYLGMRSVFNRLIYVQETFNHEVINNMDHVNNRIDLTENNNKELLKAISSLKESLSNIHERNNGVFLELNRINSNSQKIEKRLGEIESPVLDFDYTAFEQHFRGQESDIKNKQSTYIHYFNQCKNILDIGCGRGELLELFLENGIGGIGIDLNQKMVDICIQKNLKAEKKDAITFIKECEGSFDGIIALQVIEHLKPKYLIELIKESYLKLQNGSHLIFETLNPLCLAVYSSYYVMDITHERLYHPETVKFLLSEAGFSVLDVIYLSKKPESHGSSPSDHLEYAIVAKK